MKKEMKYLALSVIGLTLIASCKKDTVTPVDETPTQNPPTFSTANVQALFNNLATPVQSYTVNATNYSFYMCTNGTKIIIYPNAFLTKSGAPVTGVVNIEVKGVLSKKDMILNNALPVSNGQLLVSGGEVYFNATQGGQQLKMNPASSVTYYVPAGNTPSYQMSEFYANAPANLSNTNLNWATNTTTANINPIQDSAGSGGGGGGPFYYYNFQSDSMYWSNCDYFYSLPGAKTTCTVNTTGAFDNSNTTIILSMNGASVIVRLNPTSYTTLTQAFASYINSIPVGSNYTVVAISFNGTNYFYGSQAVTMTTNMVINLPVLVQTTKAQIESNLSTLP
jgi:hypothetical protein